MIAKKTKILALAVVGMMCAVAIVGAAYAAFAGSASTYNQGNNVTAGYMTLTPGTAGSADWTAIVASGEDSLDTYVYNDNGAKTAYYFSDDTGVAAGADDANNYLVKQIGTAKVFTLENKTGAATSTLVFKATASAAPTASDIKYFLKVTFGTGDNAPVEYLDISTTEQATAAKALVIANNSTGTISVAICVGYIPNVCLPDAPMIGPATAPGQGDTADAIQTTSAPANLSVSFAFTVEPGA